MDREQITDFMQLTMHPYVRKREGVPREALAVYATCFHEQDAEKLTVILSACDANELCSKQVVAITQGSGMVDAPGDEGARDRVVYICVTLVAIHLQAKNDFLSVEGFVFSGGAQG
jgi:hypothetical protein